MTDREKVIKGLEICVNRVPGKYDCNECPYEIDGNYCEINLAKDALELLKEQEAVVHCGDCENFCFDNISPNAGRCMLTNKSHSKMWFCAHGNREEGR